MSQEAVQTPHDAVGAHPDAAPTLESELQAQEAAAAEVRRLVAEDAGGPEDAPEPVEGEQEPVEADAQPEPDGEQEPSEEGEVAGDEAADTDEEAAAKEERDEKRDRKPSYVREARRREKAARKALEEARGLKSEIETQRAELQKWREEQQQWEESIRRDPLGAISKRLNVTPDQLLAQQADAQVNQIPPHIQAQLDAQRREFEEYKASIEKREREVEEQRREQAFAMGVQQDVAFIAGVSEREDAERYPYYASLPTRERQERAENLVRWIVKNKGEEAKGITRDDVLEVLDEQAKELATSLSASRWIRRTNGKGQETPAEQAKAPRGRNGGPSAKGAAEPAPPAQPQTEEQLKEAAARAIRRLLDQDRKQSLTHT